MDLLKKITEEVRMEGTKNIRNEEKREERRSKKHNKERIGEKQLTKIKKHQNRMV